MFENNILLKYAAWIASTNCSSLHFCQKCALCMLFTYFNATCTRCRGDQCHHIEPGTLHGDDQKFISGAPTTPIKCHMIQKTFCHRLHIFQCYIHTFRCHETRSVTIYTSFHQNHLHPCSIYWLSILSRSSAIYCLLSFQGKIAARLENHRSRQDNSMVVKQKTSPWQNHSLGYEWCTYTSSCVLNDLRWLQEAATKT